MWVQCNTHGKTGSPWSGGEQSPSSVSPVTYHLPGVNFSPAKFWGPRNPCKASYLNPSCVHFMSHKDPFVGPLLRARTNNLRLQPTQRACTREEGCRQGRAAALDTAQAGPGLDRRDSRARGPSTSSAACSLQGKADKDHSPFPLHMGPARRSAKAGLQSPPRPLCACRAVLWAGLIPPG